MPRALVKIVFVLRVIDFTGLGQPCEGNGAVGAALDSQEPHRNVWAGPHDVWPARSGHDHEGEWSAVAIRPAALADIVGLRAEIDGVQQAAIGSEQRDF